MLNMIISRKYLLSILTTFLFSAFYSQSSVAQPSMAEYGTILNLSGKQRMLSQKMSKEVMLVALEVDKAKNLENLAQTSKLFDVTLKGLRDGDKALGLPKTSAKRILRQLGKIDGVWADFKPAIDNIVTNKSVSGEQVATVAANSLPLLKQMNKAVGLYEKDAKKNGLEGNEGLAVTINLAGKQRMLTQKMSKEYFLIAYGHDVENNKLSLLETYSLFERTLAGLLEGDETLELPGTKDEAIRSQLAVVKSLWQEVKPLVSAAAADGQAATTQANIKALAQKNLPLLKEMNKAVGMYEKQAAK